MEKRSGFKHCNMTLLKISLKFLAFGIHLNFKVNFIYNLKIDGLKKFIFKSKQFFHIGKI